MAAMWCRTAMVRARHRSNSNSATLSKPAMTTNRLESWRLQPKRPVNQHVRQDSERVWNESRPNRWLD